MGKKNVTKYQIVIFPSFRMVKSNFNSHEDALKWIASNKGEFQNKEQLFVCPYTVFIDSHNKKK